MVARTANAASRCKVATSGDAGASLNTLRDRALGPGRSEPERALLQMHAIPGSLAGYSGCIMCVMAQQPLWYGKR